MMADQDIRHASGQPQKVFNVDEKNAWQSDSGSIPSNLALERGTTVQLARQLKSRHLQMIAIGTLIQLSLLSPFANRSQAAPSVLDCSSVQEQQFTMPVRLEL